MSKLYPLAATGFLLSYQVLFQEQVHGLVRQIAGRFFLPVDLSSDACRGDQSLPEPASYSIFRDLLLHFRLICYALDRVLIKMFQRIIYVAEILTVLVGDSVPALLTNFLPQLAADYLKLKRLDVGAGYSIFLIGDMDL